MRSLISPPTSFVRPDDSEPGPSYGQVRRRRIPRKLVGAALLVVVLGLAAAAGLWIRNTVANLADETTVGKNELLEGGRILKAGGVGLNKSQVETASVDFQRAEGHFANAQAILTHSRVIALIGVVPPVRRQLAAAGELTDMGVHLSRGGRGLVEVLTVVLSQETANGAGSPGERVLALLDAIDPKLDSLSAELRIVEQDRNRIPSSGLLPPLANAVSQLDSKVNFADTSRALSDFRTDEPGLRALLGESAPRTYLVLQQDSAELRATGGFIGSIGYLSFDHGKMSPFQPENVYNIDAMSPGGIAPPAPLVTTFHLKTWTLRDSNWSPDFAAAAKQAEFFLQLEAKKHVDGVIAIDPYFISKLLTVTGPVQVPETGDVVDATTFFPTTLNRVEVDPAVGKRFLSFAAKAIFGHLLATPSSKWLSLLQTLQSGCDTRSVQAYLHDPQAEALIGRHSCSGQLHPITGDGLMVIDSNVGGNKDDFWLQRAFHLTLAPQPNGAVRHTLQIHLSGLAPHDKPGSVTKPLTGTWGYTGWLRIYLPPSATMTSSSGAKLEAADDLGRRVLQGWLYVPFNQTVDVTVAYDVTPAATNDGGHHLELYWQKQAGRLADPITVQVQLPTGWKLQSAHAGSSLPAAKISSDLSTDRTFSFDYGPS
jgi:hypothetical protein